MKSPGGCFPVLTAVRLLLIAPLVASAQNIASRSGTVNLNHNLYHLTLLTGPGLLSPAPGVALPGPAINVGAASFRFVPKPAIAMPDVASPTAARSRAGTLTLSSDATHPEFAAPAPQNAPPPRADTLRFEATLQPTPTTLRRQERPALKRN